MDGNYIKISRTILEWEWYGDINTKVLFLHMLLKANWKDGNFKGTTVPRGSLVSSIKKLSDETSLSEREIRTAISHLKMTGEVTSKSYSKYTVFTVKNYDRYQSSDTQNDRKSTSKRHTNDIQTTTIEEGKKERREEIYNNSSCVQQDKADVESIPLNDGTEWECSVDDYEEYIRLYPAVDVKKAFRDMRAWSLSNPSKRKTHRGIRRFVNSWLSKEQDKPENQRAKKKTLFSNFQERTYDMGDLERAMIQR